MIEPQAHAGVQRKAALDRRRHLVAGLASLTDLVAVRGEGAYLFDADGTRYLDFTCGIGVTNTGHCHPRVTAAVREQAGRLLHAQANIAQHEPMSALIDRLLEVVPSGLDTFFFVNSGAEAIEAAVKLARRATRRTNLVVFQGSFHGRTIGAMSLTTSRPVYRAGYQPLMAGVHVAPYPYPYAYGWDETRTVTWCLEQLERLFVTQTAPDETAAVIIEPMLGEGGYVPAPHAFLRAVRELCSRHGILLVVDEVQTGFGRTGTFFAIDGARVAPDVLVMAKGMASGLPLSAIATRAELARTGPPGSQGSTYGGNAVACAAAAATIDAIRDERLLDNARLQGRTLLEGLERLKAGHASIGDVRGRGLMIATEFRAHGDRQAGQIAKAVQRECLRRGLLLLTCGVKDQVIRWIPPLIVDAHHVTTALETFVDALDAADREP